MFYRNGRRGGSHEANFLDDGGIYRIICGGFLWSSKNTAVSFDEINGFGKIRLLLRSARNLPESFGFQRTAERDSGVGPGIYQGEKPALYAALPVPLRLGPTASST